MKQYLMSVYQPEGPAPDNLDEIMRDVEAVENELKAAGAWVFTTRLMPASTSTVLRAKGDDVLLTDGPFTEGKEHLGGFTVIAAPDLDAALVWGKKFAAVLPLPIEIRPAWGDDEGPNAAG